MAGLKESLTKGLTTINMKTSNFMEESKYKTQGGVDYKEGIEDALNTIQSKYDLIEEQRRNIEKLHEEEKQILGNQQSANTTPNAATVFCSKCGAPNDANYKFCCKCGNPLNQ